MHTRTYTDRGAAAAAAVVVVVVVGSVVAVAGFCVLIVDPRVYMVMVNMCG